MLWIKRNLFLTVTGLTALILLGGGIWFVLSGRTRNAELDQDVEQMQSQLNSIYGKDPFPQSSNIDAAKKEIAKLRAESQRLSKYLAPVPVERVDAREFLAVRDRTLSDLRDSAAKAGVGLPATTPPYAFSFDVQRAKVGSFGQGTFPTVPEQMGEVKAICAALYEARVSRILNIRRARASSDDYAPSAPVQDYTAGVGISSNANTAVHPFEVTFTCFSAEVGQVLSSLARSPYGFIVKAVQVEPENMSVADAGGNMMGGEPMGQPGIPAAADPRRRFQPPPGGRGPGGRPMPTPVAPAPGVQPVRPGAANNRPIVLLKERRLKVTMLVYTIKPAK